MQDTLLCILFPSCWHLNVHQYYDHRFLCFLAVSMGGQRHLALPSDDLISGIHNHVAQAVFSLPFAHVSGVQASHRLSV